jgi:hypothetical protein
MSIRLLAATELLMQLIIETQKISALLLAAQGEGRDIADDEWNEIIAADNTARQRLASAIERAEHEQAEETE